MTDFPEMPWIEEQDAQDPEVKAKIARHEREAKKHVGELFHRYRKLEEGEQLNSVLNTIGIMVAGLVRTGRNVDPKMADTIAAVIIHHIEHAKTGPVR